MPILEEVAEAEAPINLPTGTLPAFVGIETPALVNETIGAPVVAEGEEELQELEDRAHAKRVLISSDAMQHFVTVCPKELTRLVFLDQVINEARVTYPMEDGWVVLNCERMEVLTQKREDVLPEATVMVAAEIKEEKNLQPTTAVASTTRVGSVAEAIVLANVAAAYQLLDERPMVALAEAAADFDALYRLQKGEAVTISKELEKAAATLTPEKVKEVVNVLSTALDGTYTSEAQAVKTAILKAVTVLNR